MADPIFARPQTGFTLLELLLVMVILAGLAAIALPQFSQLYSTVRASFERADLERQLLELPQLSRQRGRDGVLPASSQDTPPGSTQVETLPAGSGLEQWETLRIELPPGWVMRVPTPVFYHFTGACNGGEVDLSLPPASFRYILTPPLCRPQLAGDNAR